MREKHENLTVLVHVHNERFGHYDYISMKLKRLKAMKWPQDFGLLPDIISTPEKDDPDSWVRR